MENKSKIFKFKNKCEILKKSKVSKVEDKTYSPTYKPIATLVSTIVTRSMVAIKKKLQDIDEVSASKNLIDDKNMETSEKSVLSKDTIQREQSKKKRQQFENSLFLPNNKKRKDVLKKFNTKTKSYAKKTVPKFVTKSLNKLPVQNQSTTKQTDSLSKTSDKADKSSSMKDKNSVNSEKCNKEIVALEKKERVEEKIKEIKEKIIENKKTSLKKSTDDNPFPSYVSFRTKGNTIKLVQNKSDKKTNESTSSSELEQSSEELKSTSQELDKFNVSSFSSENSDEVPDESSSKPSGSKSAAVLTNDQNQISLADEIIDLTEVLTSSTPESITEKEDDLRSIETSTPSTVEFVLEKPQASSEPKIISNAYSKLLARSASVITIHSSSPSLPSNYSNSMEFLMQSAENSQCASVSSECLETPAEPPKIVSNIANNVNINTPKVQHPIEPKRVELLRATAPEPFGYVVRSEILPNKFTPRRSLLLQDSYIQSTTPSTNVRYNNNEPLDMSKQEEARRSVSNTQQQSVLQTPTKVSENFALNRGTSTPIESKSSETPDMPNFSRFFASFSQKSSTSNTSGSGTSSATTMFRWTAEQQTTSGSIPQIRHHDESNVSNGQDVSQASTSFHRPSPEKGRSHLAGLHRMNTDTKNSVTKNGNEASSKVEYNSLQSSSASTNQSSEIQQQSKLQNFERRMNTLPSTNRYFEPFYLQRSQVIGADVKSQTLWNRQVPTQQSMQVASNDANVNKSTSFNRQYVQQNSQMQVPIAQHMQVAQEKPPVQVASPQSMPVAGNGAGVQPQTLWNRQYIQQNPPVQVTTEQSMQVGSNESHLRSLHRTVQVASNDMYFRQPIQSMQDATNETVPREPPHFGLQLATIRQHLRKPSQSMQVATNEPPNSMQLATFGQHFREPSQSQVATIRQHVREPPNMQVETFGHHFGKPSMQVTNNETNIRSPQPMRPSIINQQPREPIQVATNEAHQSRQQLTPPRSFQEEAPQIDAPRACGIGCPHHNLHACVDPTKCCLTKLTINHANALNNTPPPPPEIEPTPKRRRRNRKSKTNVSTSTATSESPKPDSRPMTPNINNNQSFRRPNHSPQPNVFISPSNSRNQHRFAPYPTIQQQNMFPNNNPYNGQSEYYGYSQNNESSNIYGNHQHHQSSHQYHQNHQHPFGYQGTGNGQVFQDSRNYQCPNSINNNLSRYNLNNQNPYLSQYNSLIAEPSRNHHHQSSNEQQQQHRGVETNQWINARYQNYLKTGGGGDRNETVSNQPRPQEANVGTSGTGAVNTDAWMRARAEQATRPAPPPYAYNERSIDLVLCNLKEFMLKGNQQPSEPIPRQNSQPYQPWQQMTNNVQQQPTIGNNPMQHPTNSGMGWGQYNHQREMEGNTGKSLKFL
ncbi:uncharacterized protein LOC129919864 isoform X2 [Episyrphus balteatus]|uniref:uncharacterized protein LOC129919864 isoform X2 n=1 Tax=Episyrphus balteatus TaxID=286459 RepID=UPI002485533C|nr:uncharacterized protein LOC129919864 isoform X2 [Episyrphus balteatus]